MTLLLNNDAGWLSTHREGPEKGSMHAELIQYSMLPEAKKEKWHSLKFHYTVVGHAADEFYFISCAKQKANLNGLLAPVLWFIEFYEAAQSCFNSI